MISNSMLSEQDIFKQRINNDLVAYGNFSATDLISQSVNQEEFENIEPGLFENDIKKSKYSNLRDAKKSA